MKILKPILSAICVILFVGFIIGGLMWAITGSEFSVYEYFAPKFEQVRRETFEQSKAYNQGMVQEIQNMQFEYEQTDEGHKKALRSVILHRVADYDLSKMPADTRNFIEQLKKGEQ